MKMFKLFAWVFLAYGMMELVMILFVDFDAHTKEFIAQHGQEIVNQIMPLWKHWFIAISGIAGGISMLYFIGKLEIEIKDDSYFIRLLKEGKIYSIFFICLGIQMIIVEWNSLPDENIKIICSVVILIGVGWNFLCRYLMAKNHENI